MSLDKLKEKLKDKYDITLNKSIKSEKYENFEHIGTYFVGK